MFCLTAIFAVLAVHRYGEKIFGVAAKWWLLFLSVTLLLSNSFGVLIYFAAFLPLMWIGRVRPAILLVRVMAALILLMPLLRVAEILPLNDLIEWLATYNAERASSLQFRFDNETLLIERWSHRPWFGYGGFGRERIYSPSGEDLTVIDSDWIFTVCYMGVVGFLATYLLFLYPIWKARKGLSQLPHSKERSIQLILFVMLAFGVFDLMINGIGNYLLIVTAGALFGLTEWMEIQKVNVQRSRMDLRSDRGDL
jgi:hypothetical protein